MASLQQPQEVREVLRKMSNIFQTKERLYAHIGHAVSSFSAVEHGLQGLFFICSDKLDYEEATKIFGDIGFIKARITLVDYAVRMKSSDSELDNWKEIQKTLLENNSIRNFASHYHINLVYDVEQNDTIASLRRPEYAASRKKDVAIITEEQLESAGRELDRLHSRIVDLIETMGARIYG